MKSKESVSLLLLRFALFLSFLYGGTGILFGWFNGAGLQRFAGFMHFPVIIAVLVGIAEIAGSLAMISGILTRIGALCIMIVMIGAMSYLPHGFSIMNRSLGYPLTEFVIALSIFITGPGAYTLARLAKKDIQFILQ